MWLVELAKAVSWPLVTLVVATIYKSELRRLIVDLLRRKIEFTGFGVTAKLDANEQNLTSAANPASQALPSDIAPTLSVNPASALIEEKLYNDLSKLEESVKVPLLVQALAGARLAAGHEFTYNRIFGSQIAVLKRLHSHGALPLVEVKRIFDQTAVNFPDVYKDYTFGQWLDFLERNLLVNRQGDDINITAFGSDFLVYLVQQRLSENKLL